MVIAHLLRHGAGNTIKAVSCAALLYVLLSHLPGTLQKRCMEWLSSSGNQALLMVVLIVVALVGQLISRREELMFCGVPQRKPHETSCVIWLHGVGDSGFGFDFLRKKMVELPHVKWVLPDASHLQVTGAEGLRKRAWFDTSAFPVTNLEPDDPERLDSSIDKVLALVDAQIAQGIDANRIVVGGFSQGAALAVWVAARCPHRLAAVVLWSGFVARASALPAALKASGSAVGVPFLVQHGKKDLKVLPECGSRLADVLESSGVTLRGRHFYDDMGHECCEEQIAEMRALLKSALPLTASGPTTSAKKGRAKEE